MKYCRNCGNKLNDNAKFCEACGTRIEDEAKQAKVLICPRCGDVINSFTGKCKSCGTEFYNIDASKTMKEFSNNLLNTDEFGQKLEMIKTFPIPNSKEDIIEFMILASSNIGYTEQKNKMDEAYEDAWVTKFMQGYQKAKMVLAGDREWNRIQKLYNETIERLDSADSERNRRRMIGLFQKNIGVIIGAVLMTASLCMDLTGANSSMMQLFTIIILIISVSTLKKREAEYMDYAIAAGSGVLPIAFSFLLNYGAMFELGGAIVLLLVAMNFFRNLAANKIKG